MRVRDHRVPRVATLSHVRLPGLGGSLVAAVRARAREQQHHVSIAPLQAEQPLYLLPHLHAQVDAEREQPDDDHPEANIRRAALPRAPLAVLAHRPLATILPLNRGWIDRRRGRRLFRRLRPLREATTADR